MSIPVTVRLLAVVEVVLFAHMTTVGAEVDKVGWSRITKCSNQTQQEGGRQQVTRCHSDVEPTRHDTDSSP